MYRIINVDRNQCSKTFKAAQKDNKGADALVKTQTAGKQLLAKRKKLRS